MNLKFWKRREKEEEYEPQSVPMTLEDAKTIKNSLTWKQVCSEIDDRITKTEYSLRSCSLEELVKLQATIDVFERVKRLPQDVIDREEDDGSADRTQP